ncbi:probetacellulin [Bombina bombina]|uniref:probetacellulin n=1 Tax=Bombina bombina TaxID=8345 RepID=UPI00235AF82E|nr:probetacellulin [Bombina bombina]
MDTLLVTGHLLLALVLGFRVLPCGKSDGNITAKTDGRTLPCLQDGENCTGLFEISKGSGHFSRCPKKYKHYCVKGKCHFFTAEKKPACMCETGYTGSRCEYLDLFYLKGDRGQVVVIGLISAMVTLVILIICICICSHHCRKQRRRKRKANEVEALNDDDSTVKMEETQFT